MIDRAHLEAKRGEHTHYVVPTTGEKRCCLCLGVWPCEQAEILDLALENEQLTRELLTMVQECDKTIRWRKGGMRPATDTSIFASTSLSGVLKIKRYFEEALNVTG